MKPATDALTHWTMGATSYVIRRFVADATGSLRGWDTADEYLLQAAADVQKTPHHWLILNDDFGALTTAVCGLVQSSGQSPEGTNIHVVQDTSVGREAIARNLKHNHRSSVVSSVIIHKHLDTVPADVTMDILLAKIPKTNAVLDQQLRLLRSGLIAQSSALFLAGMVKHLATGTQAMLEAHLGPTQRHLAVRKSRLFHSQFDATLAPLANRYPRKHSVSELNLTIHADAGVFSSEKPDPATLFLGQHIPTLESDSPIMDLGCGSGILGIVAGKKNPMASVFFVDTSTTAIRCAEHNVMTTMDKADNAIFLNQHRLSGWPHSPLQLIVCNPPFHQKHTQTLSIARDMFSDAQQVLAPGGQLLVVANRHLPYHSDLRRLFGNHSLLAENTRFRIHQCIKST